MDECVLCGRIYDYSKSAGHTRSKCNSCSVNIRRFALKQRCLDYKGGKCARCGYFKSKRALVFHHTDPTTKEFTISGKHCRKWERIKTELDKCELLCSNCHLEEHERIDTQVGRKVPQAGLYPVTPD